MRRYNDDPIEANASAPQTCHESLITDDLGSIGGFNRFGNGNMTLNPPARPAAHLFALLPRFCLPSKREANQHWLQQQQS